MNYHLMPFAALFGNDFFDLLPNCASSFDPQVEETDEEMNVSLDMPGYEKSKISILREENTVTISAERQYKNKGEMNTRKFIRRLALPEYVNLENIDAEYKDGILTIRMRKKDEAKPRKINIR